MVIKMVGDAGDFILEDLFSVGIITNFFLLNSTIVVWYVYLVVNCVDRVFQFQEGDQGSKTCSSKSLMKVFVKGFAFRYCHVFL